MDGLTGKIPAQARWEDAVVKVRREAAKISGRYLQFTVSEQAVNFKIPSAGKVTLRVFDASGKLMETVVNEYRKAGNYRVEINFKPRVPGVYLYSLLVNNLQAGVKKVAL